LTSTAAHRYCHWALCLRRILREAAEPEGRAQGAIGMTFQIIDFSERLRWPRGARARVWFAQPRLHLSERPPFIPIRAEPDATGIDLLRAIIERDRAIEPDTDARFTHAPTLILLPEYSVAPNDYEAASALARSASRNTLIIFGLGQLTEAEARRVERDDLWEGASAGKYTNCAVVTVAGDNKSYLQPKIHAAKEEEGTHWPGKIIRYFLGTNLQFSVLVCSEFLDRAEHKTTADMMVNYLLEKGRALNLIIWIQHNRDPRHAEFRVSVDQLQMLRSTIFVVNSRPAAGARLRNYAVSGGIVPNTAMPSRFDVSTRHHHYSEPLGQGVSRYVILHYENDVNLVETVLSSALHPGGSAEKADLFHTTRPHRFAAGALAETNDLEHLKAICAKSVASAAAGVPEALHGHLTAIHDGLIALHTRDFLAFLDLAILPQPPAADQRHAAGNPHPGGDYRCRCWVHRTCIDEFADNENLQALPFIEVLKTLVAMRALGPPFELHPEARRTYLRMTLGDHQRLLAVVYGFGLTSEALQRGLTGTRPAATGCGYIVVNVADPSFRPSIFSGLDQAQAGVASPVAGGQNAVPRASCLYPGAFQKACDEGNLAAALGGLFGGEHVA